MNAHHPTSADRPVLGVAAILVSVLALSLGDAVIKRTSASLTLWQLYVLRSALVVPILVGAILLQKRPVKFRPRARRWILIRSLLLVAMWIVYYAALPQLELSVAAAAYYTSPLIIVLLTQRFTGDGATPVLRAAVGLGFAGVLVMLRPGVDSIDYWIVLPLLAAALYAIAMLVTRAHCAREHPLLLALAVNVMFMAVGGVMSFALAAVESSARWGSANEFLFGDWAALGASEWTAIGVLAVAMLIGSIGAAVAYQSGPTPLVASFDYAYLVFAALWGALLFSEIPDPATLLGMCTITAGGILAARAAPPARTPN